ncbi:hypothetical protein MKX01_003252 [Papaver californicum]|nr:hypothetical protein MKX01_003252 [Papaver californicum]
MAQEKSAGTVKWFNGQKGFGFITPDDGGEDLFFHQSSIKSDGYRSLSENEQVEFEIETGDDGRTKATIDLVVVMVLITDLVVTVVATAVVVPATLLVNALTTVETRIMTKEI